VLARSALAAGANGLFIETHPQPGQALSDGPNMIPLADMRQTLKGLLTVADHTTGDESPAGPPARVPFSLVRSTDERASELLLTEFAHWQQYAARASEIRLRAWEFAVSSAGRVLVRGVPLPPLPGRQFVVRGGVAVPAGTAFDKLPEGWVCPVCGAGKEEFEPEN